MSIQMTPIERVQSISPDDFYNHYVKPQKPVIIEQLTKDWPAYEKWNFDYIKQHAGDQMVALYNNDPVDYTKKVNEPDAEMQMSQYLDQLEAGQTTLRIFFFNLLKKAPKLTKDFNFPNLRLKFIKGLPALFFGGYNVNVFMHYDIDYPNLMHFHFVGKKRCILVSPEQTPYMYRIPHSVIAHEAIDFDHPDFEKWPALRHISYHYADLKHGEALYMPEGWWHYMKYITPGFSMTLRALPTKTKHIFKALTGLFITRHFDNLMRQIKGPTWLETKNQHAIEKTNKRYQHKC